MKEILRQISEFLRSGFLIPERYVFQRLTLVVSGSCRGSVLEAVCPLSSRFRRKSAFCRKMYVYILQFVIEILCFYSDNLTDFI